MMYQVGLIAPVCANLYVRADSVEEARQLAEKYISDEEESSDVYLDEDRYMEEYWKLDGMIDYIGD